MKVGCHCQNEMVAAAEGPARLQAPGSDPRMEQPEPLSHLQALSPLHKGPRTPEHPLEVPGPNTHLASGRCGPKAPEQCPLAPRKTPKGRWSSPGNSESRVSPCGDGEIRAVWTDTRCGYNVMQLKKKKKIPVKLTKAHWKRCLNSKLTYSHQTTLP